MVFRAGPEGVTTMETERIELDHTPRKRKMFSRLTAPENPTVYSVSVTFKELLAVLIPITIALVAVLKFGSEAHWRFWAKEKVDAEVQSYTEPLAKRLSTHESAFVTRSDYAAHLEQEVRDRESLRTWLNSMSDRVDFIYQEAYRSRFGSAPPPAPSHNAK